MPKQLGVCSTADIGTAREVDKMALHYSQLQGHAVCNAVCVILAALLTC